MKDLIRPLWLLFCFLCATITANSQVGFNEAKLLMKEGQYSQANLAYEYIVFQSDDPKIISQARLGRARALKKMAEYGRAAEVLSTINLLSADSDLQSAILYEEILIKYLNADYQGALSKGLFGKSLFKGGEYRQAFLLLMSLTNYQLQNFKEGQDFGITYLEMLNTGEEAQLLTQFALLNKQGFRKLKDPERANHLSTFLPGLGQVYAGYTGEGLLSFGLHTLSLGGAVWTALSGYYMTAWLGAAIIILRLHAGGRLRATELAAKKNRLEIHQYSQPIIDFLLRTDPST